MNWREPSGDSERLQRLDSHDPDLQSQKEVDSEGQLTRRAGQLGPPTHRQRRNCKAQAPLRRAQDKDIRKLTVGALGL